MELADAIHKCVEVKLVFVDFVGEFTYFLIVVVLVFYLGGCEDLRWVLLFTELSEDY